MIGEIKRYIRDDGPIKISRSIKELGIKIKELQRQYFYKNGEEISLSKISKELKVSKEDIALALEATNTVESIESSIYTNQKDGNNIKLIETIVAKQNEEEIITNRLAVKQLLEGLEKRDKEVIMLRFFKEKTQSEVAKILGITQVQVSRIERRILGNMKEKLLEVC